MVLGSSPLRSRWGYLNIPAAKGDSLETEETLNGGRRCLLSAEAQADCLLEIATDPNVLGRAWRGLLAFI